MDFKVAGTEKGITAIQLDVKNDGLTDTQVVEIVTRARTARMQILEKMLVAIPQSRGAVSEYAPKVAVLQIPSDKIGEVIGPGGKSIKNIIAQTGADVDIDDDGTVTISGIAEESVQKAVDWISGITREVMPGEEFEGEVKRILPFGAFIEYLPGREGMVHVSKMKRGFVKDPSEVVAVGDVVKVKVEERDMQGRINLTMLLGDDNDQPEQPQEQQPFDRSHTPFERRNDSPNDKPAFNRPDRSDHPLSRQLRRQNDEQKTGTRGKFAPRKRFSR
jgi:polyribonucleotide nucleotidyltransferase